MTNYILKICILLLGAWTLCLSGLSQENWELKKDKNGIQVFILDDENSTFKPYRSVIVVEGSIEEFESILKDIPNMPDWAESIKEAHLLNEIGDSIQILYSEAKAPFPFKNRDGIYQNSYRWSEDKRLLMVDVKILPDYIELVEHLERVSGHGYWRIKDLGEGKIEIFSEMHIDPGGNIPAWLANSFADENPYQTMMNIRELMEKD